MAERTSLSGLTQAEARDFHKAYMSSFIGFTIIALGAHLLLYAYKPWFW
jgi:light-harvesting complex 1 beta chain